LGKKTKSFTDSVPVTSQKGSVRRDKGKKLLAGAGLKKGYKEQKVKTGYPSKNG